ncbi:putative UDP-sugar transporter protein SLC35A4 [Varanus komodoensis]|uniref:probable UDP-sugar transporter protein SLC35A4 n=1 Tax=Varanus komodoensis TaxID=61221 RepID=UPI001CF7AFFC|nr:probable UDP-sugar transporter protein SLC35A4 [Varanus komodoensis]KAF7235463.1 putative UDP-sugar transporter protein SLC35A4 [Varanus komodoensis]
MVLGRGLWGLMLLLSVALYGSHAPLLTLTKENGQIPFSASSAVVLTELTKLVLSLVFLLIWDWKRLRVSVSWYHAAPFALSALLYAANNNLVVHLQLFMDPSTYQVLSNLKIGSTALLFSCFLHQRLSLRKWLALLLLMAAGAFYAHGGLQAVPRSPAPGMPLHITPVGLLLISLYCLISGLSAVYTERVLKAQELPLNLQNMFLYFFGVLLNMTIHLFSSSASAEGFLEGFSFCVLFVIVSQALNGLIMSVVMKHSTNITRLFVISSSMMVNALLSVHLFSMHLTPCFFFSVLLICFALYLYYGVK